VQGQSRSHVDISASQLSHYMKYKNKD